jgi:LCP family protein required for cell wall assembly
VAGLTAGAVLLAAGLFVAVRLVIASLNSAIPQADLFGVALPSASGSPSASAAAQPPANTPPEGADITGPLNFLIAGEDTRENEPGSIPHSDAILIMHISADLTHAYITSLPRDMLVNVPAYGPSGSGADFTKITHAMTYGARVPGGGQNTAQGFGLLAQTVTGFTGLEFNAGALVSFTGLAKLADAIGGIDIYVDHDVTSIHRGPDGTDTIAQGGPFAHYGVGPQHLVGWQVLDYARQRYGLPSGAYDRERHHRQIVKAMISKIFSFDLMNHPFVAAYVVLTVGPVPQAGPARAAASRRTPTRCATSSRRTSRWSGCRAAPSSVAAPTSGSSSRPSRPRTSRRSGRTPPPTSWPAIPNSSTTRADDACRSAPQASRRSFLDWPHGAGKRHRRGTARGVLGAAVHHRRRRVPRPRLRQGGAGHRRPPRGHRRARRQGAAEDLRGRCLDRREDH